MVIVRLKKYILMLGERVEFTTQIKTSFCRYFSFQSSYFAIYKALLEFTFFATFIDFRIVHRLSLIFCT